MVVERFQIYSVKITANTSVSQKIESVHFYSCPQEKLSPGFIIILQTDGNCPFLLNSIFWRYFFFRRKGGQNYGFDKITQKRYQSQALINSTIFANFTVLVYVLLCNNLASSMLKCEGSLT